MSKKPAGAMLCPPAKLEVRQIGRTSGRLVCRDRELVVFALGPASPAAVACMSSGVDPENLRSIRIRSLRRG